MGVPNKRTRTKTRRRDRDLDQIKADVTSSKHLEDFKTTKAVEDLPGLGAHYCIECSKWFEAESNLEAHKRGKRHKRRVKLLKEEPYTQKEAEAAAGLWTYDKAPVSASREAAGATTAVDMDTDS